MLYSHVRTNLCHQFAVFAFVLFVVAPPLEARPKTDIVHLRNGDRLTGEIRGLDRGKLTLLTDAVGTVAVEWSEIDRVKSEFLFEVETEAGGRFFGLIQPSSDQGKMDVEELAGTATLEQARVVVITPIEETFWQALEGSVDVGFDYTQANTFIQWTVAADTKYRADNYQVKLDYNSRFQKQEGSTSINRNAVNLGYDWFLGDRWYANALSQFMQSAQQSIDFRTVLGGGVGRYLIQNNRTIFSLGGGLVVNIEKFKTNETFDTDVEAFVAVGFDRFLFRNPELDSSTTFALLPSVSLPGRVRLDLRSKLQLEVVKDLYWSVTLFETFDSDPPALDVRRNDFGITTSLGWSF